MSLGTYIGLTPGAGRESNNLLVIKYLFRSVTVQQLILTEKRLRKLAKLMAAFVLNEKR